jgi:hypothetical protein
MSDAPRTLRYRNAFDAVEARIVDALPDIVAALIVRARAGDALAANYLLDRVLGHAAAARAAPADDRFPPYTLDDFRDDPRARTRRTRSAG